MEKKHCSIKNYNCNQGLKNSIQELFSSNFAEEESLYIKLACLYLLTIFNLLWALSQSLKPSFQSTLYKFIALGPLSLNPFTFGLRIQKNCPYNWRHLWETTRALVGSTFSYGRFGGQTGRSLLVLNVKTIFSILNEEETGRLVCIPRILVRASLKAGVTSLMRRIREVCSWRLIACVKG